uniref:Uncharacterized protein n=1 Tax=Heterorhabditis bacteriophora TaxID=37862 RepID=A0A1I7X2K7_HETBA
MHVETIDFVGIDLGFRLVASPFVCFSIGQYDIDGIVVYICFMYS